MSDLRREKEELRLKRAQIDQELLALLVKRARLAREWAASHPKERATLPSSERDMIDELASRPAGDLPADAVRAIFREIHGACRALEAPVRVAYVGPEGDAAHVAARRQFGPLAELVGAETVTATLGLVDAKRCDFAVLPYESTLEGPVPSTILALRQSDLKVIALHEIDTTLALLSLSGNLKDVEKVYATAQDRVMAKAALSALAPRALVLDAATPMSACELAAKDPGAAGLALEAVGKLFDLASAAPALAEGDAGSHVRFCVVAGRPAARTGHDATAVLFSVSDEPGALFEVLKQFAERGVNLRKIQSRPFEGDGLAYLFFVEVSGHVTDRSVVTALEGLKKQTKTLKVLGSYPV
jgi:chorismate mutase / prephenate dehydratase